MSIAQSALHIKPSCNESRNKLASLMLQTGGCHSSLSVLSGSTSVSDLRALPTTLVLRAIALAMDGSVQKQNIAHREIQRAIMLSPSNIWVWTALAFVRSRQKSGLKR